MKTKSEFTGKRIKLKSIDLKDGVYCVKVDTTPDDVDYEYLYLTHQLIQKEYVDCENYVLIGCIKKKR